SSESPRVIAKGVDERGSTRIIPRIFRAAVTRPGELPLSGKKRSRSREGPCALFRPAGAFFITVRGLLPGEVGKGVAPARAVCVGGHLGDFTERQTWQRDSAW